MSEILNDRSREHISAELDKDNSLGTDNTAIPIPKQSKEEKINAALSSIPKYVQTKQQKTPTKSFKTDVTTDTLHYEELPKPINVRDEQEESSSYGGLLDAYIGQLLQRIMQNMPKWLELDKIQRKSAPINTNVLRRFEQLYQTCPPHLKIYYNDMMRTFKQGIFHNDFITELNLLRDTLPQSMTPVLDKMIVKIIDEPYPTTLYSKTSLTHEEICNKLELSQNDLNIINTNKIDLQKEWNNYI
jgi:hypothetical protein